MNSREIELVLKARLEASEATNDASALGASLARTISDAFNGLGEVLASKIIEEFKTKIGQLDAVPALTRGTGQSTTAALTDADKYGNITLGQSRTLALTSYENEERVARTSKFYGGPAAPINTTPFLSRTASGVFTSLVSGATGIGGSDVQNFVEGSGYRRALEIDDQIRKIGAFKEIKKIDPEFSLEQFGIDQGRIGDLRKDLQMTVLDSAKSIYGQEANENIKKLIEALQTAAEATRKQTEGRALTERESQALLDKEKNQSELDRYNFERERAVRTMRDARMGLESIDEMFPGERVDYARRAQAIGKGLTVGGHALGFFGNYSLLDMQSQAGAAAVANFSGRQALDRDYSGMLATAFGGGEGELRRRAQMGAGADIGMKAMIGAGSLAASFIPGIGPLGAAMFGMSGASTLMSTAQDAMLYQNAVSQKMASQVGSQYGMNKEQIDAYVAGRSNSVMAYNDARSLGSVYGSQFLTGFDPGSDQSRSIMSMSAGSGLSADDVRSGLRGYMQSMGGIYGGFDVFTSQQLKNRVARNNVIKALGFSNIEQVSGGFYTGLAGLTMGPIDTRDMAMSFAGGAYADAVNRRVDQQGAGDVLTFAAGRAASGFDTGTAAMHLASNVIDYAANNQMYNNRSGMSALARMDASAADRSVTGSGMMGIARARAVEAFERENGITLDEGDRMALLTGRVDAKAMQLLKAKYQGANPGAFNADAFNRRVRSEGIGMYKQTFGDGAGNVLYNRDEGGTNEAALMMGDYLDKSTIARDLPMDRGDVLPPPGDQPGRPETLQDFKLVLSELSAGISQSAEGLRAVGIAGEQAAAKLDKIKDAPIPTPDEYKEYYSTVATRHLNQAGLGPPPSIQDWLKNRRSKGPGDRATAPVLGSGGKMTE